MKVYVEPYDNFWRVKLGREVVAKTILYQSEAYSIALHYASMNKCNIEVRLLHRECEEENENE